MKISFLDFWGDFIPDNNFIIHSIRQLRENVEVVDNPDLSDLIICSLFGHEHKKYTDSKQIIFYTGENIRPNFSSYHKSISFDMIDDDRNIRIPLWYFYIDWFDVKTYGNPSYLIPVDYLYGENEFTNKKKDKFCCTVFSAPHQDRFQIMSLLNTYKQVDGFGKVHTNRIPDGERYKMDIISDYKFNICFDNSIYPGYFTEKLLHAKISGAVPIYRSHESMSYDFNPECCVNANNMQPLELLEKIIEIDNDQILYKKYLDQPLFSEKIDIYKTIEKINKIL
jgi:hypothetical protein